MLRVDVNERIDEGFGEQQSTAGENIVGGGFGNIFGAKKGKKYLKGLNHSPRTGGRFEDAGVGSLASLMLSSKVNTIDKKNQKYAITLYGEDVRDAFGTSESIGQCVSFFPRDINEILKERHGTVLGCILFIDISGFTKLSSALCTQGSNGIDLLRQITDNSFAQFVECVYLHGGDVIEFAGDSVLCLFKSETDQLQTACYNAVRCGLHVSKFRIDGTHTHVGISCGTISISVIGGYHDQYTHLMNSPCLETVGNCLTIAGQQELVIDDAVFSYVESAFTFSEVVSNQASLFYKITGERSNWQIMSLGRRKYDSTPPGTPVRTSVAINSASTDSDHHPAVSPHGRKAAFSPLIGSSGQIITRPDFTRAHLSLDEMSARQIMSCVPRPVLQGIITNSLSGLSEMRTVTTLFLKLDSFTFTEYADATCLDEFFVNMQKCLFECGGMLRQFLVDDKGCVLIGLWGVPTASHAANCSKAMRCAVMMQSASKELGYSSSIGITTGSVYCGIVGTSYRRDYVAIGRSVNLAARLMCKAHGRILLDDDTFKRLPLNVTCYTSLTETLELKGIDPGALFHCYWSTTLPISTTDISDDRILVIESYIRRDLSVFVGDKEQQQRQQQQAQEQLQEQHPLLKSNNVSCDSVSVSGSTGYHNRPMILSRHSFEETSIQGNPTPASSFHISSKILIIRGTSGSGKTALANYAIRRIIEPHAANPHFLAPVYVCLNTDDDNIPYSTIKKIVGALFAWTQLDGIHQGDFIKKMLRGAFPKFPEAVIANYIYPPLKEALGFAWEWNVPLPDVTAVSATTNGGSIGGGGGGDEPRHRLSGRHDQSPARSAGAGAGAGEVLTSASLANPLENTEKSFQLTMSEFLYFILSDGIPVVAIDDAHFMCSGSWAIINMLSRMGCSAKIILTLRVHESSFFAPSDSSFLYSPGSKEGDADLLDRSLTPGGFDLLENQSASTSSRRTDTPSRHCSEYLALCRQMDPTELFDIVLRPLSRRTIRRLLEKEFPVILIPQDTIDVICAISRGSPYLLWKIIQYVRDSGTQNINDMISHLKDNSFMVSMLDNLPQSHGAVLKLASVIGEEFSKELLERIIPSQLVTQLSSALQNLENRGLLATLSEGHYIFSSSVIRKFVYDLIPPRYSISSSSLLCDPPPHFSPPSTPSASLGSDAKNMHRQVARQIEILYADCLFPHLNRLCYHYSMSGLKPHMALTVKYASQLIEKYLDRREVESSLPFLSVAMKCASSRNEFHLLKELLSRGIGICTEHVSNDQSCHRDALSAFTLSRLVDMHAVASERDTIRYTLATNYEVICSYFSFFFKKSKVVPLLLNSPPPQHHHSSSLSFDHMNSRAGGGAGVEENFSTPNMSLPQPFPSIPSSVSII